MFVCVLAWQRHNSRNKNQKIKTRSRKAESWRDTETRKCPSKLGTLKCQWCDSGSHVYRLETREALFPIQHKDVKTVDVQAQNESNQRNSLLHMESQVFIHSGCHLIGWSQSQIKEAHLTFFRLLVQISISSKNAIAETPRRVMDHTLKPLLAVRLTCKANAQHAPEVVLQ